MIKIDGQFITITGFDCDFDRKSVFEKVFSFNRNLNLESIEVGKTTNYVKDLGMEYLLNIIISGYATRTFYYKKFEDADQVYLFFINY